MGVKKNTPTSSTNNSISKSDISTSGSVSGRIKRDNADKIQLSQSDVTLKRMAENFAANPSPVYQQKYIESLVKSGYDKNQLVNYADSINHPLTQEQSDKAAQGVMDKFAPISSSMGLDKMVEDYVGKQVEGIKQGATQLAKGAAKMTDYRSSISDVGTGALNAVSGTAKTAFGVANLVVPQMVAFTAATEAVHALPAEVKSKLTQIIVPSSINLPSVKDDVTGEAKSTEQQQAEQFDTVIDMPFAAASTIAKGLGYNPEESSGQKAALEIVDLILGGWAMHKISSGGGETKIKDKESLLSTINKLKNGEATELELQDYSDFTKSLQNITLEDIQHEATKQGKTEIADQLKEANKVPDDELHTKLAHLQETINSEKIQSLPDTDPVKLGLMQDHDKLVAEINDNAKKEGDLSDVKADNEAKVAVLDSQITDAQKLFDEEQNPTVKESYQNTINNLKSQKDAIQKQSTSSVLQYPQEGIGETGSERGRMEQSQQRNGFTETGTEIQKQETEKQVEIPEKKVEDKQSVIDFKIQEAIDSGDIEAGSEQEKVAREALSKRYDNLNELKQATEEVGSKKSASLMFAPFFDLTIENVDQANKIRQSPAYKQYVNNVYSIADHLGIKITKFDDTIGGFENEDTGAKIIEPSTKIEVDVKDFEHAKQFAALMGVLGPESQKSSIAARYLGASEKHTDVHSATEYTMNIDNIDKTIKALKEAEIDDYAINESDKTLTILDFSKKDDFANQKKFTNLAEKLKENGVNYGKHTARPIQSELIESAQRAGILNSLREGVRESGMGLQQGGAVLRDIISEAIRKNDRFREEQKVEPQRKEYSVLREKQIALNKEGKDLSSDEMKRKLELEETLHPVLKETIASEEKRYTEAKTEIEDVAKKVVGDKGFVLPFGIKNPMRAATKILDWYNGKSNLIGDGARTNIIVDDIKNADAIFAKIKEEYSGGIPREELGNGKTGAEYKDVTEYGYPKRLLEVRTKNGKVAEFQVMEPLAYIAKDGVKEYKDPTQKATAEKQLVALQEKLGEKIPDGAGHWFYEIGRDSKVQPEIQEAAKDVSITYYQAFTKPEEYLNGTRDLKSKVENFNKMVENADRSGWVKDHLKNRPESIRDYLKESKLIDASKYEEIQTIKSEKVKSKAKEKFVEDNFDSIVAQLMLKNKIKRKC